MVGCEGGVGGEDGAVEDEEMIVQGFEHGLRAEVRRDGGGGEEYGPGERERGPGNRPR